MGGNNTFSGSNTSSASSRRGKGRISGMGNDTGLDSGFVYGVSGEGEGAVGECARCGVAESEYLGGK